VAQVPGAAPWEGWFGERWLRVVPDERAGRDALRGLLDRWQEPHRRYHTLEHLRAVLTHLEDMDLGSDRPAVELAAWYHDAVYSIAEAGNEARSAALAASALPPLGVDRPIVRQVVRLVRLTESHDPAQGDHPGESLCDADLAVLGQPPPVYEAYRRAVRSEYASLDDQTWQAGRTAVLDRLLAMPVLYRTALARARWEAPARANLAAERAALATD
jgi:predicted metal-dependent HD superfamily phosphohydrolase